MTLLGRSCAALFAVVASACAAQRASSNDGELAFKAHSPKGAITFGQTALGLATERDGFLFVPHDNAAAMRQPLLILLHGATHRARLFERITATADSVGVVILAPDSRTMTWDAIRGEFGPDIEFLNRAIMRAFDRAYIDPCHVAIGGFSDGASYALSLGIRNARLLPGGVVAFSPGFVIPTEKVEKLPVFMRHGTRDQILPIDQTSRRLAPQLREAGFALNYEEFDGPHTMRPVDARAAMEWLAAKPC